MAPGPGRLPRRQPSLLEAVRAAVRRHRLLDRGDRVLVAVSGGADSVALLHALTRLRTDYALALTVCHVHHGLRPEADRDAAFVLALAARLGCPATVERVQVAPRPGRSPEGLARAARYAALGRAARATGATRIALGHTADDQAETVLMRLLQGAGPRGLAGIPVRRGRLVRPLLEVDRSTVLAHLAAEGLEWVEDATNRDPKMLRNRIRHDLLPLLAAQGWPRIRSALRRTARAARETVEALDVLLVPEAARLVKPTPGGVALDVSALAGLPPGAAKALLARAVTTLGPTAPAALRAAHLDQLAALLEARPGARVRLSGGLLAERARDTLWLGKAREALVPVRLTVPGETPLPAARLRLVAELGPAGGGPPPVSGWEVWFDAAALPPALEVRAGRTGERVVPFGGTGPVRVARLLAETGAARAARGRWPLLAVGDTVLWVVGARRAAAAPVTPETTRVLRVRAVPDPWPSVREDST